MNPDEEDALFDDMVVVHPAFKFGAVCLAALFIIACVLWIAL